MREKASTTVFVLSLIGTILILLNGLLIAANGAPIVLSSYPASSVEELKNAPFWGRIAFGMQGLVEGELLPVWLFFAVVNLFFAISRYIQPKRRVLQNLAVISCAFLSIPIGGGFIVGLILSLLGGFMAMEWPKPIGETFFGRLFRALKLDSKLFYTLKEEPKALRQAVWVIIFVYLLSGIGIGLYLYNVEKLTNLGSTDVPFRILLLGEVTGNFSILSHPLYYIGIAVIKWLLFSLVIYMVGVRLMGAKGELEKVASTLAFAYAPISLQIFLPLMFSNEPFLTLYWPFTMYFLTNIWMILLSVASVRQSLDTSVGKALGVVLLGGSIYWLIDYTFITPTFKVVNIQFTVQPPELMLAVLTVVVILATLLGVFTRR